MKLRRTIFLVIPIVVSFQACIPFHPNTSIKLEKINSPQNKSLNEKLAEFRAKEQMEIRKMEQQMEQEFNEEEGSDNPLLDENVP